MIKDKAKQRHKNVFIRANKRNELLREQFELGGNLSSDQISGISGLAGMAGDTIQSLTPQTSMGGQALGGAASGAAAGLALGPIGAIAGGVIGGVGGLFKGKQAKDAAEEEAELKRKALDAANITKDSNAFNAANKMYAMGGDLNNEITQYQGNSHANGGIQLGQTGNEVEGKETRGIGSTKDYIFSEKLKYNGKSFAQHSKDIEKRFKDAKDPMALEAKNRQLESLKNAQENMQQSNTGTTPEDGVNKLETGGYTGDDPTKIKYATAKTFPGVNDFTGYTMLGLEGTPEGVNAQAGYKPGVGVGGKDALYKGNNYEANARLGIKNAYAKKGINLDDNMLNEAYTYHNSKGSPYRAGYLNFGFNENGAPNNTPPGENYDPPSTITSRPPGIDVPSSSGVEAVPDISQYTGEQTSSEATPPGGNPRFKNNPFLTAASALPNALGALGNWKLSQQVNYDRVNPARATADYVDPTRAIQENRDQFGGAKDVLRQNSRGSGGMKSNLIGATASQAKANASVQSQYDNQNAGIFNQLDKYNTTNRQQANMTNAQIGMQEVQDRLGFKQQALESGTAALGDMFQTHMRQKRDNEMLSIMGSGEQTYARVDGQNVSAWWDPNDGKLYYQSENGPTLVPGGKDVKGNSQPVNKKQVGNNSNSSSNKNSSSNTEEVKDNTIPSNITTISNKSDKDITPSEVTELGNYIDELTSQSEEFSRNNIVDPKLDALRMKYLKLSKKNKTTSKTNSTTKKSNTSSKSKKVPYNYSIESEFNKKYGVGI